jgi:acetylglutamate/LysW-gamma-L-alpha-aminoadipate kinase
LVIVAKIGGSVLQNQNLADSLFYDIRNVASKEKLVLVHGGGDEVTRIAESMGKKQRFVESPEGIKSRYTDRETASIYTMAMSGKIGKEIVVSLLKHGVNAVGLSGIDGALLRAERKKTLVIADDRGKKLAIDGGYTGKINNVKVELLETLLHKGLIPVVSPVALGEEFEFLNVDGDRACSHMAGFLKSDAAIFLTDQEGVMLENRVVVNWSCDEATSNLSKIGNGMDKKVIAAVEAVRMGAKKSIIASGFKRDPMTSALRNEGTVITP